MIYPCLSGIWVQLNNSFCIKEKEERCHFIQPPTAAMWNTQVTAPEWPGYLGQDSELFQRRCNHLKQRLPAWGLLGAHALALAMILCPVRFILGGPASSQFPDTALYLSGSPSWHAQLCAILD